MQTHRVPFIIAVSIAAAAFLGLQMGLSSWVVLGAILLSQNMTFTLASRARNSESLAYVALAQLLANGTFILSLGSMGERMSTWPMQVFYCLMTTFGGTLMVYLSAKYIEKGKRRVGGSLADEVAALSAKVAKIEAGMSVYDGPPLYCLGCKREPAERVGDKWLHITSGTVSECTSSEHVRQQMLRYRYQ